MNILHIVSDEKFIHFLDDKFSNVPGVNNHYLVVVSDVAKPLVYLNGLQPKTVLDGQSLRNVSPADFPHDAVIIHYLDASKVRIVRQLRTTAPVVWSGWGGDYYEAFGVLKRDILGPLSIGLEKNTYKNGLTKYFSLGQLRSLLSRVRNEKSLIRFMADVDYFSAPIPDDYRVIQEKLPFNAQYQQINYGSVERTFEVGSMMSGGADILVGNSASISNNHLEVFALLSRHDLEGRRIVVPLSYGNAEYRDRIIVEGRAMFGARFAPLVDFMSLDQYNTTIASCSIVIMGHQRQQAVGNIATMLYKGARVFLHHNTTTFRFLNKKGARIFKLQDLDAADADILKPLGLTDQHVNAQVIRDFWGDEIVQENARQLVEKLRRHKNKVLDVK